MALPSATQAAPILYVFDAVLKLNHAGEIRLTEFPVQTGANITDHAIKLPKTLSLDIAMSDAMDSYYAGGWSGHSSKSVNAFQTMVSLRDSRVLVSITTRLLSYSNMMLVSITSDDSNATNHGLRATLHFREVFLATVTATSSTINFGSDVSGDPVSARPQTTDSTNSGTAQLQNPSATVTANNQVPSSVASTFPTVPGAGDWSSTSLSSLAGLV